MDFIDYWGISSAPAMRFMEERGEESYFAFKEKVIAADQVVDFLKDYSGDTRLPRWQDFIKITDSLTQLRRVDWFEKLVACLAVLNEWDSCSNDTFSKIDDETMAHMALMITNFYTESPIPLPDWDE